MIKKFKIFEHNNNKKFRYGDIIIYKRLNWRNESTNLKIMVITSTPGPIGTKYIYYTVNVLYELINGELEYNMTFNPTEIEQEQLEKNVIYHTTDIDDAKEMIFIVDDTKKYNI